jgi:light-regulated signal transduction histidine kinase (bacteriophytochrome)
MANRVDRAVGHKKAAEPSGTRKKPVEHWRLVDRDSYRVAPAEPASVSKISHDIRTQLYIIIGFAELMLEEIPGKISDEQRRNLNDVLTSGKRLLGLLQDIVDRSANKSSLKKGG